MKFYKLHCSCLQVTAFLKKHSNVPCHLFTHRCRVMSEVDVQRFLGLSLHIGEPQKVIARGMLLNELSHERIYVFGTGMTTKAFEFLKKHLMMNEVIVIGGDRLPYKNCLNIIGCTDSFDYLFRFFREFCGKGVDKGVTI